MTRMTGPDCVVMCNLINTHTHTHTHNNKLETETGEGAGRGQEPERGWRPVKEHKLGTRSRSEAETITVAETGTGTGTGKRTGLRTGFGRAEERGISANNRTIVVDAMWETRETWAQREKRQGRVG